MYKYYYLKLIFLLVVSITSCNRQKKTNSQENNTRQTEQKIPGYDPYFVESTAINSVYGPVNITRNIIQDSKGYVWLATWEGIIKYDGHSFTNFTNKDSLKRFRVFSALEDKAGNLWFGTVGAGLYLFDGKSFTNLTTNDGLVNNSIGCFYEDKAGRIWIGTQGGISVYQDKSFTNFTSNEGLTNNDVNSIIEDRNGRFWIGTRGQACFYEGGLFSHCLNNEGEAFTNVRSIIEDAKGNIWLGGNDGFWRYANGIFTNINKNFAGYIYEDKKGNIWTSSVAPSNPEQWELIRYDEKYLNDEKLMATSILKKIDMFFGILEDKAGDIWLGTLNGVCHYDGSSFNYFKNSEMKQ